MKGARRGSLHVVSKLLLQVAFGLVAVVLRTAVRAVPARVAVVTWHPCECGLLGRLSPHHVAFCARSGVRDSSGFHSIHAFRAPRGLRPLGRTRTARLTLLRHTPHLLRLALQFCSYRGNAALHSTSTTGMTPLATRKRIQKMRPLGQKRTYSVSHANTSAPQRAVMARKPSSKG